MVQCNGGIHEMQVGDFEQCPHRFPEVDIRLGSGVSTELCEEHAAEAAEDADYEAVGEEVAAVAERCCERIDKGVLGRRCRGL